MTAPRVAELAAHVEALAAAHGLDVGGHSRGGRAWRAGREVRFRPVRSAVTYAVALHEIGHVVGGRGRYRLEAEALAWEWALRSALPGSVRRPFRGAVARSLRSYLTWAEARQHRAHGRPRLPEPGHLFWRLFDEVGGRDAAQL